MVITNGMIAVRPAHLPNARMIVNLLRHSAALRRLAVLSQPAGEVDLAADVAAHVFAGHHRAEHRLHRQHGPGHF